MDLCEKVMDDLIKQTGSDKVSCIELDLTLFKSVKDFAAEVKKRVSQNEIYLLVSKDQEFFKLDNMRGLNTDLYMLA